MQSRGPSQAQQKILLSVAILLILTVSLVSYQSTRKLVDLSSQVEQSQNLLVDLHRLISHLKDVESGARGYALTSDPRQLEPHRAGTEQFGQTLERLKVHAFGRDALHTRLERIGALGSRRIALSQQLVQARSENPVGIEPLPGVVEATATMNRIRNEVNSLTAAERIAYRRLRQDLEQQTFVTSIIMAVGVLLSLATIVWLFSVRGREVARRRQAEQELRTLNADLEARVAARTEEVERSSAVLNAVIENMPDTVFLKDVEDEYRYVLVNEAAERLLGRARDDLLGKEDHELFPRGEAALCRNEDEQVARSGLAQPISERALTTEHGQRLIESRKALLLLDGGSHRFVLGIVRDITDQRSVEGQLREMQRMDSLGRLTGGVAHDFNNLLAIIMGSVELVRSRLETGSEAAEIADEAMEAASRGAELVRRLLAFARKQHLAPTVVQLNERLPSITPLLQRTLGERIRVQVRPAPDLWPALIDPTQVDDTLVNLAINARDAMPQGGSLTIETANTYLDEDYAAHHLEVTPGEYIMLAVSDTGTGMAPETIDRAFEPFFTTKGEGRGTGLGLSQVYGWVKQSGGHIKIYSELGRGTTIKLYLPRARVSGDESIGVAESAASSKGHETILVVEDNPNVRRTVVRQLTALGYSAVEAEDARSALGLVRQGVPFDLLLTDIVMPGGMTGYELADEVEQLRPEAKILLTSGYTELAETHREAPGSWPLLSKPYRRQDLGRAIRSVLDNGG